MRTTILCCIFSFFATLTFATHNRAGEITYRQIDHQTLEATITTYTKTSSFPADRDSLIICWGDGICQSLNRSAEVLMDFDYKMNVYVGQHRFNDSGAFTLSVSDPNRNGGILNVNEPNSDQVAFHIASTVFQLEPMVANESNQSPIMLESPIDIGFVRQPFMHTPNAIDLDGDSITYELITPLMENGQVVPNYIEVDKIGANSDNTYSFNEQTGLFIWNSPQIVGEYSIAIKITSYRDGQLRDMVIRDMQILIMPLGNTPPKIQSDATDDLIKIKPGQEITFHFSTTDDTGTNLPLSASSELFLSETGATFTLLGEGKAQFNWTIRESQIRFLPYQLVIKAVDEQGAATFKVIRIKVNPFSTGTIENFIGEGFEIFPNPTTSQFSLQIPDYQINKPISIAIYDTMGRLIQEINFLQAAPILQVNQTELATGNYIVLVRTKKASFSTKLVIK